MAPTTPMQDDKSPEPTENPERDKRPSVPGEKPASTPTHPKEVGGPDGLEPTRYGDWERNGRCTDF